MIMRSIKTKNLQAIQSIGYGGWAATSGSLCCIVPVSTLILPCLDIARAKLDAVCAGIGRIQPEARCLDNGWGAMPIIS